MGVAARQLLRIPEIPCPACEERWTQSTGKQLGGAKRAAGCQGPGDFHVLTEPGLGPARGHAEAARSQGKAEGAAVPRQRAVTELSLLLPQVWPPAQNPSKEQTGNISREPLFQGQPHPSSSRLRILRTQEGLPEPWESQDSP